MFQFQIFLILSPELTFWHLSPDKTCLSFRFLRLAFSIVIPNSRVTGATATIHFILQKQALHFLLLKKLSFYVLSRKQILCKTIILTVRIFTKFPEEKLLPDIRSLREMLRVFQKKR